MKHQDNCDQLVIQYSDPGANSYTDLKRQAILGTTIRPEEGVQSSHAENCSTFL